MEPPRPLPPRPSAPRRLLACLLAVGGLAGGALAAQEASAAINDVCPVMPEEGVLDDMDIFVEYEGATVALCCKRCKKEWLKDPEPFVAWLRENGFLEDGGAEAVEAGAPVTELVGVVPAASAPQPAVLTEEVPRRSLREGEPPASGEPAGDLLLPSASASGTTEPARPGAPGTPRAPERAGDRAAAEPGPEEPWLDSALERAGRFHPLLVHFPVALLIAALAAQVLGTLRGRARYEAAARFCLALGAAGAVIAAAAGWASAATSSYPSSAQQDLFLHRWVGTATAAAAALAWVTGRRAGPLHRSLVVLAALGVAVAGYYGGNLIYGPGHLFGP